MTTDEFWRKKERKKYGEKRMLIPDDGWDERSRLLSLFSPLPSP